MLIARTGYSGEDGFEVYIPSDEATTVKMWNALLDAGAEFGIRPCGLGARNTLRLEAGMSLYGHEISEPPVHRNVVVLQRVPVPLFRQSARFPVGQHGLPAQGSERLSSVMPLQSLSMSSHTSTEGPVEPEHSFVPLLHTVRPALHGPTQLETRPPGQLPPQTMPTSVRLLSVRPSQLSSRLLQIPRASGRPPACR